VVSKLLLTDAYSALGSAISHALESRPYNLLMPEPGDIDWGQPEAVLAYLEEHRPAVVINSLGWAEKPDVSQQLLLVTAAKHLAAACHSLDIVPIHLSSFRVFGGENKSAYDERDKPSPLGPEGRAFLEAERSFEGLKRHINLRLSWVLSEDSSSLVQRYLSALTRTDGVLELLEDYRGAPTHVGDVARVISAMIPQIHHGAENWGAFHYASNEAVTEVAVVEAVADILRDSNKLKGRWQLRELSEEEAVLAPSSAVLSVRRCRDNFGVQTHGWRQGLKSLVDHILQGAVLPS
jgi:dTDP-4-dehydrorhamnose reductase